MKTRTGFVSNSSASSFIIKAKEETTATVALKMLEEIIVDYEQYFAKKDPDKINAAEFLKKNKSYDKPICLPWSINYETFIYRDKFGDIKIATSRNHEWFCFDGKGKEDCSDSEDRHYEFMNELKENKEMIFLNLTNLKEETFEKLYKWW